MPFELNTEQLRQAVEIKHDYLRAPANAEGQTVVEFEKDLNERRLSVIEHELRPLLSEYLAGNVLLAAFKTKVDGINDCGASTAQK